MKGRNRGNSRMAYLHLPVTYIPDLPYRVDEFVVLSPGVACLGEEFEFGDVVTRLVGTESAR